jgi:hypothetical protein
MFPKNLGIFTTTILIKNTPSIMAPQSIIFTKIDLVNKFEKSLINIIVAIVMEGISCIYCWLRTLKREWQNYCWFHFYG